MDYAVVFFSISTNILYILQRIQVTGGELWNFNKLRCPTHGCSFADFPLALKSFHHSFTFSSLDIFLS